MHCVFQLPFRVNRVDGFSLMARMAVVTVVLALSSGCSVGLALHGHEEPNMQALQHGQKRDVVILNLGNPEKTYVGDDGQTIDEFVLHFGNEPSVGRAAFHGAMDVLTLGGWELVGTPIEAFAGEKRRVTVMYVDDRVASVGSTVLKEAPDSPSEVRQQNAHKPAATRTR